MDVKADLSTRFADWIETNLLKVDTSKVRKVVFDNYKMQEIADAGRRAGAGPGAATRRSRSPARSRSAPGR